MIVLNEVFIVTFEACIILVSFSCGQIKRSDNNHMDAERCSKHDAKSDCGTEMVIDIRTLSIQTAIYPDISNT